MNITPLPCPFCGGSSSSLRLRDGSKYGAYECGECGAQGPDVRTGYGPEEEWREKATAAWNGRCSVAANGSTEEHELLGYIEPPVLLDLLQGSDTSTKIRSAVPSLTNPDPRPGESWAVPIFVVRRQGGPQ